MTSRRAWLCGGALGLGLVVAQPVQQAAACGGLFCSSQSPVNQAAERIIFSFDRPAKRVTAVVEILYQGPAEKFAWVLPVPGIPEIGVSSGALLDRLQSLTNPTYGIQRTWGDTCGNGGPTRNASAGSPGGSGGFARPSPGSGGPMVAVLASGSVGPYNFEVIKVEPANSDPADVAIAWLETNGYDVGTLGPDVLRPYLRDGLNLVAFRLSKNRSAGSIRPVVLSYDSDHPMIPIRPTAVAANDDMGILVWVLGGARAVPTNYKTLEINEAVLDWFNPSSAYNDVISAAADEAGGQGFVTELATPSAAGFADSLFPESSQIEQFRSTADPLAAPQLIVQAIEMLSTFSSGAGMGGPFAGRAAAGRVALDGLTDVLSRHLELPAGVEIEQVMAAPRCYFQTLRMPGTFYCEGKPAPAETLDLARFDRNGFLTDLEKLVMEPLEKTAQLFRDQRYLTRLYTTMSPRDMTLDPEFDLNSALPDVASTHTVALKYLDSCAGDTSGRWTATLENAQVVHGRDASWPFTVEQQKMPVNRRVMQLSATGPARVLQDNTTTIARTLTIGAHKESSRGCALALLPQPAELGGGAALCLIALATLLSRRRHRR
jgi:hypothetical protein